MIAEATCISKPMTIIPLVVASVQDVIAAGQILQTNQLTDMSKLGAPGTVLVSSNLSIKACSTMFRQAALHRKSLFEQQ